MGKMRWYKRDPDAALGGMMGLTLEERGAYNTVLDLIYTKDDQLLDDDYFIAGWCQVDVRVWKRIKASLVAKGKLETSGGVLRNFRATSVILAGLEIIGQKEEAGRAGGRKSGEVRRKSNNLAEAPAKAPAKANTEAEANTSRLTTTTTIEAPPLGGAGAAPPPFTWEAPLSAVDGVKGSGLEQRSYAAMVQLQWDGFDLNAEVIPVLKQDIVRARQEGRLNKLAWTTIARKVRENRAQASAIRTNGHQAQASTSAESFSVPWEDRIAFARENRAWPAKWGPYPNQPGCLVPAALVNPDDGKGWIDWKPKGAS